MNRKQKTKINIAFSFLLELFSLVSGFILPRLIISTFGSDINGLNHSIADFIAYISLLQTGVGSAIKAALYKPLAKGDHHTLSIIVKTTERFFYKIAAISIVYIVVLSFIFQPVFASNYDYWFTLSLVLIIGLGTAAQYLFGITYQMVLEADQRAYVYSIIQIATIVCNTIAVILAVRLHASIIIVKLCSAAFFTVRPIILGVYTRKKYRFDKSVTIDNSYIKQRWNAFGQGVAFFIHSKTDIFVLTVVSTFTNVSIYSVYTLVTKGLSSILNGVEKSIRSAFGNIIANGEHETLQKTFKSYLSLMHLISTAVFSTASVTCFRFVNLYTHNVSDANYYQPLFGLIIIAAECLYCLRLPYYTIIYAAGKFKETEKSAFIEAGLNLAISIILVYWLGLVGVAIGTFVAMGYRTIAFVVYLHKNILCLNYRSQIKRYSLTTMTYILIIMSFSGVNVMTTNFISWFVYSGIVFCLSIIVTTAINFVFDRNSTINGINLVLKRH